MTRVLVIGKRYNNGHENTYANYSMGGVEVTNSSYERDLGAVIDESLNYNRQCAKAVLSANSIMGIINRTCSCKVRIMF